MLDTLMSELNLDGFQIVSGNLFSTLSAPTMTIWPDSISFSQTAYSTLNNCDAITLMLNKNKKSIAVSSVQTSHPNAIIWKKGRDTVKYSKISCTTFARKLYDEWGYDPKYRYKALGRLVTAEKRVMLLFEFSSAVAERIGK